MFGLFKKSKEEEEWDEVLNALKKDRKDFDKKVKAELQRIEKSDWSESTYLRKILYEIVKMNRRMERP